MKKGKKNRTIASPSLVIAITKKEFFEALTKTDNHITP